MNSVCWRFNNWGVITWPPGYHDRAEDMFNQLTDETDFRIGALQQLLQIYPGLPASGESN